MGFGDLLNTVVNVAKGAPVIGHTIALVQVATGDTEGAKDTAIRATANTVTVAGAAIGSIGGPAGAAAGGALGGIVGGQLENKMRGKDFEFTVQKVVGDASLGVMGGTGGGFSVPIMQAAGDAVKGATGQAVGQGH